MELVCVKSRQAKT